MPEKPSYEELMQRVRELEKAESERLRAEMTLKENERFLKDVLRAASIGIAYTKGRKIVWANEAMEQLFGYEREEEYIGMDTAALFADKADYERVGAMLFKKDKDDQIKNYDAVFVRKDGTCFDGYVRINLIDVDDFHKGVITSIVDITARKRAEEALRESEEKYRVLVENANDAICIIRDGAIQFSNKRTSELLGYPAEELQSAPFLDFIRPDDRHMVADKHFKQLNGGVASPAPHSFTIMRKDHSERLVQMNAAVFEWENKTATLNILRDITDQRKLEARLHQAQKMEALGALAGGIAHDFNNILMGVQGRTSLLGLALGATGPLRAHVDAIEDYVRSAAALTRQLLGLARAGKYDVKPVDVNELLAHTASMFGRTRKEIRIQRKTHSSPLVVEADRRQIEQLLLNLLINAWQAMPDGGELCLETAATRLDESVCKSYDIQPGRYCKISVTDAGVGMNEAVMQRIFDPFFTTKERGRGTGLGLASAFGIVKNHGGMITVYSEAGHGSTFNVYLPLSDREAAPENVAEERIIHGSETILLVDDEEIILDVGKEMLEHLGYDVIAVDGGEAALDIVRKKRGDVDLVILDLIMPGLDGGKAFDCIREVTPGMPVILSSGYSVNGKAAEILKRGCNGFIQKPFNIAELSKKIKEVLDRAGGAA